MKQRELKEAVEFLSGSLNTLFKDKTIIHFPLSYEIWIDETKGGIVHTTINGVLS